MENPIPEAGSTPAPSNVPAANSPPSPRHGKMSSTPPTTQSVKLLEIIQALAVIQDGLRQLALAGVQVRRPQVNDQGILVMAVKLNGHTLGVGPNGNFILDGKSVMEKRTE